jgi:anti-anti-sigma factor
MIAVTSPLVSLRRLAVSASGKTTVIRFTSSSLLDEDLIQGIRAELSDLVANPAGRHFVLTFAGVTRICSALLAVLLAVHRRVEQNGGRMALCAVAPDLARWFVTTRLDKILHIAPNEQDALEAVEQYRG